jgi:hypothetical protein
MAFIESNETNATSFPSEWRTSLMGSDLQALRDLSSSHVRTQIKRIIVEDDWEKSGPGPTIAGSDAPPPASTTHIWPRNDKRIIQGIGTETLQELLKTRILRPDMIIVRDFRGGNADASLGPPAQLARDILDGSEAAIISICFHQNVDRVGTCEVVIQLSPDHHAVGTSMLQEAELILTNDLDAYWPGLVFNAPNLSRLKLKQAELNPVPFSIPDTAVLNLTSLELVGTVLSEDQLLHLVNRSRTRLANLSLKMVPLPSAASWRSLLSHIATECTGLTSFELKLLKVNGGTTHNVKFEISENDIPEPDRQGLHLTMKGTKIKPVPVPRVNSVQYNGVNAASVLRIVAESVVSWGYVGGSHEIITETN